MASPRGYLAVDFFFALSGFVIAAAYEEQAVRWRLVSALPVEEVRPAVAADRPWRRPGARRLPVEMAPGGRAASALALVFAAALLVIPTAIFNNTFPYNSGEWTLFYELLGDVIYGRAVRFSRRFGCLGSRPSPASHWPSSRSTTKPIWRRAGAERMALRSGEGALFIQRRAADLSPSAADTDFDVRRRRGNGRDLLDSGVSGGDLGRRSPGDPPGLPADHRGRGERGRRSLVTPRRQALLPALCDPHPDRLDLQPLPASHRLSGAPLVGSAWRSS